MQHIDPLPPINHSEIEYGSFEKHFYSEHEDIRNLSNNQVNELRQKLGVNVKNSFLRISLFVFYLNILFIIGSWYKYFSSSC